VEKKKAILIPIRVQREKSSTRYNEVRLPRWNLHHRMQIGITFEKAYKQIYSILASAYLPGGV
jgi:hypothetical protein